MQSKNPYEVLALSKAVAKKLEKEARENVVPGETEVNFLARVQGTVKVGEDYTQSCTASMPQKKMLLAALMLNGVSVKAFVRRYLDGEFEVSAEDEKRLGEVWDELADNFNKDFRGKVTSKLTVDFVPEAE